MHGYEVDATLEERYPRLAAVSRTGRSITSLEKLARLKLIRITAEACFVGWPRAPRLETTEAGRGRLADALESKHWVHTQTHPPLLTWLALSWQARPRASSASSKPGQNFFQKGWRGKTDFERRVG